MICFRVYFVSWLVFFFSVSGHTQPASGIDKVIAGAWTNAEGSRVIEFRSADSQFVAVIRKAKNPELVGQQQVSGLRCSGSACGGGTFYLVKRHLALPCHIVLKSATEIEIVVQSGSTARSQVWTKLQP